RLPAPPPNIEITRLPCKICVESLSVVPIVVMRAEPVSAIAAIRTESPKEASGTAETAWRREEGVGEEPASIPSISCSGLARELGPAPRSTAKEYSNWVPVLGPERPSQASSLFEMFCRASDTGESTILNDVGGKGDVGPEEEVNEGGNAGECGSEFDMNEAAVDP
ncbi:hypothetical protein BGZ65_007408, partial [Modicella reniformis]